MTTSAAITAIIASFARPTCVHRLVTSIRQWYPTLPVVVADDSAPDTREALAPLLADPHCTLVWLPYFSGLSAKRNAAIAHVRTPLTLVCDDDFVFRAETDLGRLAAIIDDGLDVVSLTVEHTAPYLHQFVREGTWLREVSGPHSTFTGASGVVYPLYGLLLNAFLARTAALQTVPWDPALKMHEHGDWFMRAAHLRMTHCSDVVIGHERPSTSAYTDLRRLSVEASASIRLDRLRARGLTHYDGGDHVIDLHDGHGTLQRKPAQAAPPIVVPAGAPVPLAAAVAKAWPTGPQGRRATLPRRGAVVSTGTTTPAPPSTVAVPVGPHGCYLGRPYGVTLSPAPDPVPEALRVLLYGQRVLVLGSGPDPCLPPPDAVDIIVTANGGVVSVPADWPHPVVAVLTPGSLGLDADTREAAPVTDLFTGRTLSAVIFHAGGWTDYDDPLASTWYTRSWRDVVPLRGVGVRCPAIPWGITPTGRDRLIAGLTLGRLTHGVRDPHCDDPRWRINGWSTGLIAAAVAWGAGAAAITLAGITPGCSGHAYPPPDAPDDADADAAPRYHWGGDAALLRVVAALPLPITTTRADLAAATGLRV